MTQSAARHFLDQASLFRLGSLPTEGRHPLTLRLSEFALSNLDSALKILHQVEFDALKVLRNHTVNIEMLSTSIRTTLQEGGRIFFCGCGATGRLSLAIETLWRESGAPSDKVFSFMAGGDYALIRSIEKFEDHFDYGARQLRDAGFRSGDLLIATTEGGETPFVIGATEEAVRVGTRRAIFLYCNPTDQLCRTVERSRRVIENPQVQAVSFEIGAMALAGSTRLQASSVLMLAAGAPLFSFIDGVSAVSRIEDYIRFFETADVLSLKPFIETEAALYAQCDLCIHRTDKYGITVVTDTTERTPTFSLLPFEASETERPAWTYLSIFGVANAEEGWRRLLHREPRALDWLGFSDQYGIDAVTAFDFSTSILAKRQAKAPVQVYDVLSDRNEIVFKLQDIEARFAKPSTLLAEHLFLKALLNFSSTLVMGRLGRFSSNLMLYVRPTNNKLIDRSIRFVSALLEDSGCRDVSYEAICEQLFEILPTVQPDEPVVLLTFNALLRKFPGKSGRSA